MCIKPVILRLLIELGNSDNLDAPFILDDYFQLRPEDYINRLNWRTWDAVTAELAIEDLVALLKGLTICEMRFHWCGGSVSAVIWVYRELQKRNRTLSKELYEWTIRRTHNPYAPTGTSRTAVIPAHMQPRLDRMEGDEREQWFLDFQKSVAMAHERRLTESRNRIEKEKEVAQQRKRKKQLQLQEKTKNSDIRSKERRRILLLAEDLNDIGRLKLVVENDECPLLFFPTEWAMVSQNVIAALDKDLRARLYRKISNRKTGHWKELAEKLGS